jgi:hypothetical protein
MLIETERWVIGIESKFFAEFQQGQPQKYVQMIKERADPGESNPRRKPWLIVLAPRARIGMIREKLIGHEHKTLRSIRCSLVAWEALFDNYTSLSQDAQTELKILKGFYDRCCDPFRRVTELVGQLPEKPGRSEDRASSEIGGDEIQREFLKALATFGDLMPNLKQGRITRTANEYSVFEFPWNGDREGEWALFGFVDKSFYGVRGPGLNDSVQRAFVMCLPRSPGIVGERRESLSDLGLHQCTPVPSRSDVHGIIRHREADGEVWAMEDAYLLEKVKSGSGEVWQKVLRRVFF